MYARKASADSSGEGRVACKGAYRDDADVGNFERVCEMKVKEVAECSDATTDIK